MDFTFDFKSCDSFESYDGGDWEYLSQHLAGEDLWHALGLICICSFVRMLTNQVDHDTLHPENAVQVVQAHVLESNSPPLAMDMDEGSSTSVNASPASLTASEGDVQVGLSVSIGVVLGRKSY